MSEENKYTFENEEYRKTYWHTCSHVLAQAVKRLWPEVKLAIGPSIDGGFYYDLDAPFAFTQENLAQIEAEMRKICKEKLKLERFELPREEEAVEHYEVDVDSVEHQLKRDQHRNHVFAGDEPVDARREHYQRRNEIPYDCISHDSFNVYGRRRRHRLCRQAEEH